MYIDGKTAEIYINYSFPDMSSPSFTGRTGRRRVLKNIFNGINGSKPSVLVLAAQIYIVILD
ncbi:MAG: hypothetical protein Q4B18_08240 [Bacillota bacterium]|nr:hypothetical protein [Bacillota bacterium]